jgi:hypothetical protein
MSDFWESIGIALSVAVVFGVPFGFFAFVRYLRYKETIALAERGLLRPSRQRRSRDTLRWGIIITMLGIGLTCGLIPAGFLIDGGTGEVPLGLGPWLLIGILPVCFGLALIIIHVTNKDEESEDVVEDDDEQIPPHKAS